MPQPWEKYKIGSPSKHHNFVEPDCRPFTVVDHVSHVESALRIIEDGRIRQSLVFDESKLNVRRILVVWLSPNDWTNGYRYGNVKFTFEFSDIVKGRNFYWVEDIDKYSPPACRILITDQDRSGILQPYDPSVPDGPWWRDKSGNNYRNGGCTLEFILEADLNVRNAKEISFVQHHAKMCSSPDTCTLKGAPAHLGGAEFLRAASAKGLDLGRIRDQLYADTSSPPDAKLPGGLRAALEFIVPRYLDKVEHSGDLGGRSKLGMATARGVLNAIVAGKREEAENLAEQFADNGEMCTALAFVVTATLDHAETDAIVHAVCGE